MRGHVAETCRQHLQCDKCNRRGHATENCFAQNIKKPSSNNMAFTRNDIPKWTAYIHGNEVQFALDSGAENSVISIQALKRLNLKMRD